MHAVVDELRAAGLSAAFSKVAGRIRRDVQMARYDWNLRRFVRSPESVEIDRPVFIVGVQGGGITLFARCFYRHPKVVYATGNWRWWAGEDEIHNSAHTVDELPPAMAHRSYHFGNVDETVRDHPLFGYQRAWLYAIDELLDEYRRTAVDVDDATREGFRRVIQKVILAYADAPDDCRFVDMSQLYTIQIPFVATMLAESRPHFVLTARNPYATVARAAAKEYTTDRGARISEDPELRLRCAVEHWSNSYRIALESRDHVPMTIVRYEDFLRDPERTIRDVCAFADLPFESRQVPGPGQKMPLGSIDADKWYPLKASENDRYLDQMPEGLVPLLNQRAGDVIEALGYELLDSDA